MEGRQYSEKDEVNYETRVIAFIDILGWGDAVSASATSLALRGKLLNAVWALGEFSRKDIEEETLEQPSYDRATQFSDSLAISFPYHDHRDLLRLIRQITGYQRSMLLAGFPLRGGITVGLLHHEGSLVFGPAMNSAYHHEHKLAVHPRVIIDKKLDYEVLEAAKLMPRHWPFVIKDDDGFYSTDFLAMFAGSPSAAANLDLKIEHWLDIYSSDSDVRPKYDWLKRRWEAAKAR